MRLKTVCMNSLFGAGMIAFAVPALAQNMAADAPERVVISASLLGSVPSDLLTSSATVLTPLDLETRQTQIVSDVLRDVPGVSVNRGGAVGSLTQVRIRGAESNHTLVLIDGIKASDPFFGEFDFATLLADDVARVEVLRGEQSALYGSDAIGGVIQYITATGADAPGFRARLEGGSFNTVGGTARFAGVSGPLDYAVNAAYQRTDGTPDSRFGTRDLGSRNGALSGKFIYSIAENFRLKAIARYSATDADVNEQDFNFPPRPTYGFELDGNGSYKNTALYGLLSAEFEGMGGHWRNAVTVQGVDAERNGYGNNFSAADVRTSGDKGMREKATYVTSYEFGTAMVAHKLTGSVDWEREYYQNTDPTGFADTSKRHTDNNGYVGQYDLVFDKRLALNASGRFDQNYRFENSFTYHLGASYLFDGGFRLHTASGTGIKAPTIYQLYGFSPGPGGFVSNPDLKPERSQGWEIGGEQNFLGGAGTASVTYFHSTLKDEIDTVFLPPNFDAVPENLTTRSTRDGVETALALRLDRQWRIDVAYTYLRARENGLPEVRRPDNIASLNVAWRETGDRYGANLTVRYNGDAKDFQFTPIGSTRVNMPAYTLVNLDADYRINDMWQLYGRVENLFDAKYEEQFSFRSPGRALYAGVHASFQ